MEKKKKTGKTLQTVALVLAIIAIALCFIVWIIPFVGPAFVICLAIAAIIISIIALVRVSSYNSKNIHSEDFEYQNNTKAIVSAIVSVLSLVLATLFLILHVFVFSFIFTNFDNITNSAMQLLYKDSIQAEYGVAYEIEDEIMLTIDDATYQDDMLTVKYSITNNTDEHKLLFLNSFYYTSSDNPSEKIYPYQNPIFIEPNVKSTSETIQISMPNKPATVGYDSISGQSIVVNVK